MHPETVDLLARDRYRWLSPGLFMESDRRVAGLSSLALTNRPNLQELRVSLHDADLDTRETELDTRAAELDAREADLERQDQERVTTALDAAVEAGDITRETVEYHRAAIGTHETVDAGLAAFRAATPRLLSNADRRTAPAGAPRRQGVRRRCRCRFRWASSRPRTPGASWPGASRPTPASAASRSARRRWCSRERRDVNQSWLESLRQR